MKMRYFIGVVLHTALCALMVFLSTGKNIKCMAAEEMSDHNFHTERSDGGGNNNEIGDFQIRVRPSTSAASYGPVDDVETNLQYNVNRNKAYFWSTSEVVENGYDEDLGYFDFLHHPSRIFNLGRTNGKTKANYEDVFKSEYVISKSKTTLAYDPWTVSYNTKITKKSMPKLASLLFCIIFILGVGAYSNAGYYSKPDDEEYEQAP